MRAVIGRVGRVLPLLVLLSNFVWTMHAGAQVVSNANVRQCINIVVLDSNNNNLCAVGTPNVAVGYLTIGTAPANSVTGIPGPGFVSVPSGTSLFVNNGVVVGFEASGTLQISGTMSANGGIPIGAAPGIQGTVSVSGPGAVLSTLPGLPPTPGNLHGLNVGFSGGVGNLSVTNGGAIHADFISSADTPTSVGTATISGAGSQINVSGVAVSGNQGQGTFTVQNGGALTAGILLVGNQNQGSQNPSAILNVQSGGEVTATSAQFGALAGSSAMVTVAGSGSQLNASSFVVIGDQGSATVSAQNGGAFNAGELRIGDSLVNGASGTLNVTGLGATVGIDRVVHVGGTGTGNLSLTNLGQLVIQNPQNPFLDVGSNSGSIGAVTVDNAQLILRGGNGLIAIGNTGTGNLVVINGGKLQSQALGNDLQIGIDPGATGDRGAAGKVTVSGAGSQVDIKDGGVIVGFNGSGELAVQNQANLTAGALNVATDVTAGVKTYGVGTGKVTVSDGGTIQLNGSPANGVGPQLYLPTGTVTITGANSQITLDGTNGALGAGLGGSLLIGATIPGAPGGTANLSITSGGNVTVTPTTVTATAGAGPNGSSTFVANNGSVSVSGSQSVLNAGNTLALDPSASINVSTSGALVIGQTLSSPRAGLTLNSGGVLQYNLTNNSSALITANDLLNMLGGSIVALPSPGVNFAPNPGTSFNLLQAPSAAWSGFLNTVPFSPPGVATINGSGFLATSFGGATILAPELPTQVVLSGGFARSDYLVPNSFEPNNAQSILRLSEVRLSYIPDVAVLLSTDQESLVAKLGADSTSNTIQINSTDRDEAAQALAMTQNLLSAFQTGESKVATPGGTQQMVYQMMLGHTLGTSPCAGTPSKQCVNLSNLQAAITQNSPFAQAFLNYDPTTNTFSLKTGVDPKNPDPAFLAQMKSAMDSVEASTGKPISKHIPSNTVQAVDIQSTNLGDAALFVKDAQKFLGVPAVLCPVNLGCQTNERAGVIHLTMPSFAPDPFAGQVPTSVQGSPSGETETYHFAVSANIVYALDPQFATGFIFEADPGSPYFSSIMLPDEPLTNGLYEIMVDNGVGWQFEAMVAPDSRYFFLEPGGAHDFEVLGIDLSAGLTPNNIHDFVAQVSFDSGGAFDGSITPILTNAPNGVPEPGTLSLLLLSWLGMVAVGRKPRPCRPGIRPGLGDH